MKRVCATAMQHRTRRRPAATRMGAVLAGLLLLAIVDPAAGRLTGVWPGEARAQSRGNAGSPGAAINVLRRQHGLQPVRPHPLLQREAQKHSRAMAAAQRLTHQIQPGMGVFARLSQAGFNRPVAENVSYGGASGVNVIARWSRLSGHRANMLDPRYTVFGFASATDRSGRRWWTLIIGAR